MQPISMIAVAVGKFESGGFGVEDDLAHGAKGYQLAQFVDAAVRERVGALVLRMAGVAAHPVPLDVVRGSERIELLPQVLVLDRLAVGRAPAAALPVRAARS